MNLERCKGLRSLQPECALTRATGVQRNMEATSRSQTSEVSLRDFPNSSSNCSGSSSIRGLIHKWPYLPQWKQRSSLASQFRSSVVLADDFNSSNLSEGFLPEDP